MDVFRLRVVAFLTFLVTFWYFFLHSSYPIPMHWTIQVNHNNDPVAKGGLTAANSTLGFGALVAVSRHGSPRRDQLLYAANLTGLDIHVPDQPVWTEADEAKFRSPHKSRISHGSMMAWFGHLNALKWFLSTGLESALIMEDDVDWDISVRLTQVPLAAKALNDLLGTTHASSSSSPNPHYWSDLSKWEILYLGHCGDFFFPRDFPNLAHTVYPDPTIPPQSRLHPKTAKFLRKLGIPNNHRMMHHSLWPLCTFGYAVTRASAQRILDAYSTEGKRGCHAYDVRILEACRDHKWKCFSANPELFHHIEAPSEIARVNQGKLAAAQKPDIDREGRLLRGIEGPSTTNIRCPARSRALFTKDPEEWKYVKDMTDKGVCLVDQMAVDRTQKLVLDEEYR